MDGDVEIRVAGAADIAEAARLRWRWIVEEKGGRPLGTETEFATETVAWAERNAETHSCLVAERGGEIVGMAWLAVAPRVPSPRAFERRNGDVQSVYVAPELRGSGVGGRLIDALVEAARAIGVERITVHSSPEAVPVYERHGFALDPLLLDMDPSAKT